MRGSAQLKTYLRHRRAGMDFAEACALTGIPAAEAAMHEEAEEAGEYADIDLSTLAAGIAVNKEETTDMEEFDITTGEILPPAADGRPLRPAASTLGQFVAIINDGQFDADVYTDMKDMAATLQDIASTQGSAKGKLTVEIDFKVENGMFIIKAKHKVKLPDQARPASVAWTTEDNRFTSHKPNQGQLFGVRDVTRSASLRDA